MSASSKKTESATPWAPGQPYITGALSGMKAANDQGTANLNQNMPGVMSAINNISKNVATPPAYLTDARTQLDKTINGDFVGKNPYIDHAADLVAQKAGAQYQSGFGAAGRAHGGLAALLSSQGIGDALNSLYGQQYSQERGLQQQAITAAPGFHADQDNTDLNALMAGTQGAAMLPGQVAGQYAAGVTGATSPYGTRTTTLSQSMLPQIIGMAGQIGGAALGHAAGGLTDGQNLALNDAFGPIGSAGPSFWNSLPGGGGLSGLLTPGQTSGLNGVFGNIGSPSPWNFGLGG